MNADQDEPLRRMMRDTAQPDWAAIEEALDAAAQEAAPLPNDTVERMVNEAIAGTAPVIVTPTQSRVWTLAWQAAAALILVATGFGIAWHLRPQSVVVVHDSSVVLPLPTIIAPPPRKPTPPPTPKPPASAVLLATTAASTPQDKVQSTKAHERRVLRLADDSLLWLDENSRVVIVAEREVKLEAGRAYLEVAHHTDAAGQRVPFVMQTPKGPVTALGTKFAVDVSPGHNEVLVTEGKVTVAGLKEVIQAGHWWRGAAVEAAPQAAYGLGWTQDLRALVAPPTVPASADAGGALRTTDDSAAFTLRRCHVDVHIEDGMARTTIDQTYFNHLARRLEGTFYFPLPPDASISRLAMYVNGKLMEGGMAEREEARRTFETIKHKMQDPALLEWVDGSTFKMRVFPLEGREEKRIIISYTQRMDTLHGRSTLRVPVGHSLSGTGKWSFEARVVHGHDAIWRSANHDLNATVDGDDLMLRTELAHDKMKHDVVLEIAGPEPTAPRLSSFEHEGWRYLALRCTPALPAAAPAPKRHWAFIVETSADRDAVLARTQREVMKSILSIASADDTFSLVTASTRAQSLIRSLPVTEANRDAAIAALEQETNVGALDLGAAFTALGAGDAGTVIVHLGSAMPILGELDNAALLARLPKGCAYASIAVGKRWNLAFARAAAAQTGGWFMRINPDESPGWRAFEFVGALNAARLTAIKLTPPADGAAWLLMDDSLAQGNELCALARVPLSTAAPATLQLTGMSAGKEWTQPLTFDQAPATAGWLPRAWAKLELDRLVADGADKHRADIVTLSKASYVMSPFTSLLVLENDAMYAQYKIDRGRKDHWALYPCPDTMAVVREPANSSTPTTEPAAKRTPEELNEIIQRAMQTLEDVTTYNRVPLLGDIPLMGHLFQSGDAAILNGRNQWGENLGLNLGVGYDSSYSFRGLGRSSGVDLIGLPRVLTKSGAGSWNLTGNNTFTGGLTLNSGSLIDMNGFTTYTGDTTISDGFISGSAGVALGSGALILSGANTYTGGTVISGGTLTFGGASSYSGVTTINGGAFMSSDTGYLTISGAISGSGGLIKSGAGTLVLNSSITNGSNTLTLGGKTREGNRSIGYASSPSLATMGDLIFRSGITPTPPRSALNSGLSQDDIYLRDLTIYAAGFVTSTTDRIAVAEEAIGLKPGSISDEARALIEKVRSRAEVKKVSSERQSSIVTADGQWLHDERNHWGLREIIVGDGRTLRHLYPEIGLGTERVMSAAYWRELMELFPWIVPPVEVLAQDADVHLANSQTLEIVPHDEAAPITQLRLANEGVVERRVLNHADRSLIARLDIEWGDGGVRVQLINAQGRVQASQRWDVQRVSASTLNPATKQEDLVLLPMPARRWWTNNDARKPMDEVATAWLNRSSDLQRLILRDYLAKGDTRPGWFVLAMASGKPWYDAPIDGHRIDHDAGRQQPAIVCYVLAQMARGKKSPTEPDAYSVPKGENAFVDHLMHFREAWLWSTATGSSNDLSRAQTLSTATALGDLTEAPGFAMTGLRRAYQTTTNQALLTHMAEFIGKVREQRHDWHLGYAEADAWLTAGEATKAVPLFETWAEDSVSHDEVQAPGAEFHHAFIATGEKDRAAALVKRGIDYLVAHDRRLEALRFAGYGIASVDAKALADQAADTVATLMPGYPNDARQGLEWLAAAEALGAAGRHLEALDYTRRAKTVLMNAKDADEALAAVLQRFLQRQSIVATLKRSLGQKPDSNDEREVMQSAAKLASLSADTTRAIALWIEPMLPDLAQAYRTSPLAVSPNEARPWLDYAADCQQVSRTAEAEYAHDRAFTAEQTNADILLRHAQFLEQSQRTTEARRFYEQIAHGTWGPNYNNAVYQAKQRLGLK